MNLITTSGTLSPAYGRDYTSGKAAVADFLAGKDFIFHRMLEESYVSVSDFQPGLTLQVRFKRMTGLASVKVP